MRKYNFIIRLFILLPLLIIASIMWCIISIFSTEALGKVLLQTGQNLLKK